MADDCRRLDTLPLEPIHTMADYLAGTLPRYAELLRLGVTDMTSLVCTSTFFHAALHAKTHRIVAAGFNEYDATPQPPPEAVPDGGGRQCGLGEGHRAVRTVFPCPEWEIVEHRVWRCPSEQ